MRSLAPALLAALALSTVPLLGQETVTLFVPVVLSTSGLNGSFFTSEMTLTNTGARGATLFFEYTAAQGGGSGTGMDTLGGGRQRIVPDVIEYLRALNVPIPATGNRFGTLRVTFVGVASASDAVIIVRTATPVPPASPTGRAGLAYAGVPPAGLFDVVPAFLCGLRQNADDRTNVAVQNAGVPGSGDVRLRLTFVPDGGPPTTPVETTVQAGGFTQFPLTGLSAGAANGHVLVERVSGSAPFYAYAVINDQVNSDGSFVPPVRASAGLGATSLTLPAVVESGPFSTEVVATNFLGSERLLSLTYVSDALTTVDHSVTIKLSLPASGQRILPSFVQFLRDAGVPGVPPAGASFVGSLSVAPSSGDVSGLFVGARTLNPGGGGRYGVFYPAVPSGSGAYLGGAWVYGLRQDQENRTNLALVSTGEVDAKPIVLRVEIFDGDSGQKAATIEGDVTTLAARQFKQIGTILATYAPGTKHGWARITKTSGSNPFLTYGVVNDGAGPGLRSGDGAFIAMTPVTRYTVRYEGAWRNTTFQTTGGATLSISLDRAARTFSATLDLQGNVFGGGPPGPQTMTGSLASDGTAAFDVATPLFGRVTGTITKDGQISGAAIAIRSANVASMDFSGTATADAVNVGYLLILKPSGQAQGVLTMTRTAVTVP